MLHKLKFVVWLVLVLILGIWILAGGHPEIRQIIVPPWDKLVHFVMFFLFSAVLMLVINKVFWVVVFSAGLAILDELSQLFLENRMASFGDLLADIVGMVVAVFLVKLIIRNREGEK